MAERIGGLKPGRRGFLFVGDPSTAFGDDVSDAVANFVDGLGVRRKERYQVTNGMCFFTAKPGVECPVFVERDDNGRIKEIRIVI